MSSSPNSSSSSSGTQKGIPFPGLDPLRDVRCPVSVLLGTGTITVRRLLNLDKQDVVRLHQSAGEDLQMLINGVPIANGEVVVVEDSTAIRLTEIARRLPVGDGK